MFEPLLGGRLNPITSAFGFLELGLAEAAEAFARWEAAIQRPRGVHVTTRTVTGNFETALRRLLPLTSVEPRRFLFASTTSPWTAFFDNGHRGTDAFGPMSYLAQQMKCRGLRVVAVQDTMRSRRMSVPQQYGAAILEVYGPEETEWLNYVRAIYAANDGGRWVFRQHGTLLPFEDESRYALPDIRQRFTFDMLERYLHQLGLSPFDGNFYLPAPDHSAILIEKHGPTAPGLQEYALP